MTPLRLVALVTLVALVALVALFTFFSLTATHSPDLDAVAKALDALAAEGTIVGGQVAVARGDELVLSHAAGVNALGARDPVDTDTLFLIASSSKPFASACVLRMMQDGKIDLDDSIDQWLPAYAEAVVDGGGPAKRAPTVAELLCHRAGIYSQKVKITEEQGRILYTFKHTLEDGVNEIAAQPLLAEPGERYAYSGAGYCALGRVTELAAGGNQSFESLLQENVCAPLGLTRTTYFPAGKFERFATGFAADQAPHTLGDGHLWPLIGGSLYTTAEEMVRLAQGVGGFVETADGKAFLDDDSLEALDAPRNPGQGYGLGWGMLRLNRKVVRLSHSGSLQGYRSWIAFDRRSKTCVAACWTLPSPDKQAEAGEGIKGVLRGVLDK